MRKTRKALPVVAAIVAAAVSASPAQATDYGRPSGKWLEAIVAHEVGHCLGWYEHRTPTSSSIMRTKLNPTRINKGYDTYKPTSADVYQMKQSRYNTVGGEQSTYYVQYPFQGGGTEGDLVQIYNKTGMKAVMTAADRWDYGTALNTYQVWREPSRGITIFWDNSLAGKSIGGHISVQKWEWNGKFSQIADCTVHLNPRVVT